MNSVERHMAALEMREADRVPVAPSLVARTARRAGVKQYDYHTRPDVLARCQVEHCDAYDFDGMIISSDNVIMYEALGGRIVYKDEQSYPFWTTPLIVDPADAARLKVPDPAKAGRMPVLIEASRLAVQMTAGRRFIMSNIDSGPFQLAATLMGLERAMTLTVDHPQQMAGMLEFCADIVIAYGTAMARTGCHGLQFGESTGRLVGPKRYEEVIFPHDKRVVTALKKTGTKVFLHVCGDSSPILDLMADTGADCLEIDSMVNMAWAKQKVGSKVALKGNVDTISFLNKPREALLKECRRVIEAGKKGGGFILCGGCELPTDTSDEALQTFRQSTDLHGQYK